MDLNALRTAVSPKNTSVLWLSTLMEQLIVWNRSSMTYSSGLILDRL